MYRFFIHSPVSGCIYLQAIINNTVVNIYVQAFVWKDFESVESSNQLNLSAHDHGISFHLLVSVIFFIRVVQFSAALVTGRSWNSAMTLGKCLFFHFLILCSFALALFSDWLSPRMTLEYPLIFKKFSNMGRKRCFF